MWSVFRYLSAGVLFLWLMGHLPPIRGEERAETGAGEVYECLTSSNVMIQQFVDAHPELSTTDKNGKKQQLLHDLVPEGANFNVIWHDKENRIDRELYVTKSRCPTDRGRWTFKVNLYQEMYLGKSQPRKANLHTSTKPK